MKFTNLPSFRSALRKAAKELSPKAHADFQRGLALEVLNRAVKKTPVDTGRLRGGWQVDVGENPPTGDTGTKDRTGRPRSARE